MSAIGRFHYNLFMFEQIDNICETGGAMALSVRTAPLSKNRCYCKCFPVNFTTFFGIPSLRNTFLLEQLRASIVKMIVFSICDTLLTL